jgi:hypothetical protein
MEILQAGIVKRMAQTNSTQVLYLLSVQCPRHGGGGGMLSAQDQQEPELRTYPCCVSPLRGVDWCCDLDLGASRCCCTDVQLKALTHLGQQGRAA